MSEDDNAKSPAPPIEGDAAPPRRIRSDELFAGAREVIIEHHGRMYRMRITQNGKLILTA
jgi:hemin uptake protein HemP